MIAILPSRSRRAAPPLASDAQIATEMEQVARQRDPSLRSGLASLAGCSTGPPPPPCFLEVLILEGLKSKFTEVLIIGDFKWPLMSEI